VTPVEQHEALRLESLLEQRRHLVEHGVQLGIRVEEHRDLEQLERVVDVREAGGRDRPPPAAADAHLAHTSGSSPATPPG
jgi:hypothetical protein